MSQSKNISAYPEAQEFLDKIVDHEPRIIRAGPFSAHGSAYNFRHKCYSARANLRRYNASLYTQDHPMHNKSPWESISLEIVEDNAQWFVRGWAGGSGSINIFVEETGENLSED